MEAMSTETPTRRPRLDISERIGLALVIVGILLVIASLISFSVMGWCLATEVLNPKANVAGIIFGCIGGIIAGVIAFMVGYDEL